MLSCNSPAVEIYLPTANLSTTWTANNFYQFSYYEGKIMLIRETNVAQFTCGFYCKGIDDCTSYLFSISISGASNYVNQDFEVVWSANRDYPVSENATLDFTADGELILKDVDGSIVWTTNTAGKSVVGMNLTDNGNLVLFDDQNSVVWQSFDYPTDSLLPGQKLFAYQKLKSTVFITNSTILIGMYSLQVRDKGLFVYVESNPPQAYYSRLLHDSIDVKRSIQLLDGSFTFYIYSSQISDTDYMLYTPQETPAHYMKLMPDGHLQVFKWKSEEWTMVEDLTADSVEECGYPLVCGRNSICSSNQQCGCLNSEYFRLENNFQPNLGCSAITPLTCNATKDQHFIILKNVTYFTLIVDMYGVGIEACKQACLNNCSCKAAFFQHDSNASKGDCYLPSELFTMRNDNVGYSNTIALIKVQNTTTSHRVSHKVARVVGSTFGSSMLLLVVAIGFITYVYHKRKRDAEMEEEYLDQVPGMPNLFSFEELTTATENFSKKLGEGGFGSVFEGSLKDGSKIAVKCLEGLSHIKKSFFAEVQSIGSIHHVNLVRLRGFCTWKSRSFLVYDFMSNKSLDRWIYHGVRDHILKWEVRKKIILDIAKGLAYLHEECRQKIVHLDIKPQNILLDNEFNAKLSDFGLSKLIDKNETEVFSTIKGTPGYIAPEWRSSIITEKLDVYSFGIVLLEILCGRKIFDRSQPEESWHLLFVFQNCWERETLIDMIDKHSEDMQVHKTEVLEMLKLASWCLQTNFKRRPSMSSVVKVLEGGMNVESNLDYNFTDPRIQESTVGDEKDLTLLSPSLLSGPR
ncbi:hypothetical protein QVD17_32174 [Tagetes erecta]|uniref:Receptor-like serine/threonine-protein kinase n=1 Tax=Tagetes erecta TaxID=13708 RepID=A0AAD8K5R2_TARER|nr:hypothetical protein QVD17_32174 [Tagetes erecta]